jgi:hypothetical protein
LILFGMQNRTFGPLLGGHSQEPHFAHETRASDKLPVDHVCDVRDPALQAIKNVRGVDDGRTALLALLAEEVQQVQASNDVQIHRDLVQQQHLGQDTLQHITAPGTGHVTAHCATSSF